jgi:8-oxo-dGTP diphosphatase
VTWPGWPEAIDDVSRASMLIGTTLPHFVRFLNDPPEWQDAHLTAIAWVLDPAGASVLLVDHRLHRWSCAGGHVEPGEHPASTAARELHEETGIVVAPAAHPFMLGSSTGCARAPRARHWTVGYRFTVETHVPLRPEPGQPAAWFPIDRLPTEHAADVDAVLVPVR